MTLFTIMEGIYFGKMKMKIQHYLCRIKLDHQKGAIYSWVDTLQFISDDQRTENSIKYEKIDKIQRLNGYERLGKILAYLPMLLIPSIVIYYQSFDLSEFNLLSGFYFSITITLFGIYLSQRSSIIIHHFECCNNLITTNFSGYKKDIRLLIDVIQGKILKIVKED